VIFAFGATDPDTSGDISYHETRRGTRMIPLQSYGQPPVDEKFAGLEYFELRLNNVGYLFAPITLCFIALFVC
jgi:hypothetical protein